jgi:predicted LPLAT superfamily acyltransferase
MIEKKAGQWTSRSIGSAFQHNIFYLLIRIGGWRLAYFILHFVVMYYILFRPSVRERCRHYLSHRFPHDTPFQRFMNSYRMSVELGKVLIDRAIVGILGTEKISVEFKERQKLLDLISEGKGIILLMAHAGCWQVALSALHFLKIKVNMVIHREEGDIDRHYFEHGSGQWPYRIIDPEGFLGGTLEMISVLRNGEALCMMGDRLLGNPKNTMPVKFLGEYALFPYSAMKIASASGAPVVVLLPYKKGTTEYVLDIVKIIRVPDGLGRSGDNFLPYISEFVKSLEDFTVEYPFQFFNFYDMWEKF